MKTIVVGIGNPILGDDGIGIHVMRNVQDMLGCVSNIFFEEAMTGGMNLLDLIVGFDKAILIDAVISAEEPVGSIKRFDPDDVTSVHSCNPHDVSFIEAIELAESLGEEKIPKEIVIIGIVLEKLPLDFSETLSGPIKNAIPEASQVVMDELKKSGKSS